MNHASLFSGIGGFELAAEALGWKTLFTCEIDSFCQRILSYYWPGAVHYKDIKQFNAKEFKGQIDILTGGFPCQPFSLAGKRNGTSDDRYLWPNMLRVIREVRPTWVVAENVYGLINWNEGLVFEQIHTDLEAEGYQVQSFILPAAGVNAPHRRCRVWIVAYSDSNGQHRSDCTNEKQPGKARQHAQCYPKPLGNTPNCNKPRLERSKNSGNIEKKRKNPVKQFARLLFHNNWEDWPTEPALCGINDGLPKDLDGITLPKWRKESIKGYGNAIVPQVALQIFKAIDRYERLVGQ
jgi:DNA (cytosine-5)-methyltransferase 1